MPLMETVDELAVQSKTEGLLLWIIRVLGRHEPCGRIEGYLVKPTSAINLLALIADADADLREVRGVTLMGTSGSYYLNVRGQICSDSGQHIYTCVTAACQMATQLCLPEPV